MLFLNHGQLRFVAFGLLPGNGIHARSLRRPGLHWDLLRPQTPNQASSAQLPGAPGLEDNGMAQTALRFGGGLVLGLVLLACGKPSFADVEDVVIPVSQLKQIRTKSGMYALYFSRDETCSSSLSPDPGCKSNCGWLLC